MDTRQSGFNTKLLARRSKGYSQNPDQSDKLSSS